MIIAKYLYVYLGFFLAFVGSIGNLLTFSVFVRRKKYRSLSSSTFLAGSTFGEQLVLLSSAFPDSLTYALNYDFYGISIEMCKSTSFLYFAGGVVALTCMYLAAIERYLQTCRSSSQREWMTLNRARLLVFLATLVSSGISIPFALYRNVTSNNQSCEYVNANFKRMAPLMYAIVGVPMPITLLSVFGFLTWRNLKTPTQRQRTGLATHKLNNQDSKRTAHGEPIEEAAASVCLKASDQIIAVGVNCVHPDTVVPLIKQMNKIDCDFIAYPNAGVIWDSEKQ
ncbi:unnamed protein product [Rotaria sp. Silwood2]|nr:unnamed protein product [Rotaria sp. Silwood2]